MQTIEEHLLPTLNINLELFTVIVKSLLSEVADTKDIAPYSLYVDSISTSEAVTPEELDSEISNYLKNLEIETSVNHQNETVVDSNSNSSSNTHVDLLPAL